MSDQDEVNLVGVSPAIVDQDEGNLVGAFPFVPQQKRAQKKRQALLESGRYLFTTKGYAETTTKEIAAHAVVATGTFYRYFSDKRQLLMALLEDQLEKLTPPEPNWLNGDPVKKLASLINIHHQRVEAFGLQRVLQELLPKDPELAEVLAEVRRHLHKRIFSGLLQAKEKGLTWQDLDVDTVVWSLLVLVEKIPEKSGPHSVDYQELAKVICRMIFPPAVLVELQKKG